MDDVELLRRVKHIVDSRGVSLRLAFLEAQGGVPTAIPSADAEAEILGPPAASPSPWQQVADLLPQPVALVDASGRVAGANIAFARAAGRLRGSLRGLKFVDLVDPHDRAKAVRGLRSPARQRRGWELNLQTGAGVVLFSFDCWPLRDRGHGLTAMIGTDLGRAGFEVWPEFDPGREGRGLS